MLDLDTQDLIALYALGALELPDRTRVEKLLEHDQDAQQELKSNLELTEMLASRVPFKTAPESLELKVLAKIRQVQLQPKPKTLIPVMRPATRVVIPWFARASLGLALAASLAAIWFGVQNQKLATDLKTLQDQKTTLSSIVADNRARVVALLAPDGKTVVGQAIITHDGRVLMAHNMGWFLPKKSTTPTSLGIFRGPSVAGSIPNEVTAVGISEEPDGGSEKPTTPRAVARM
jgi:anti-sigma factor RsiW